MTTYPYSKQYVDEEDIEAVVSVLKGEVITRGSRVSAFEEALAKRVEAKYAVAFSSGSAALAAAYYAAEAGPFDTLLTTPNTFVATAGAIKAYGSQVKFIDVDFATGNISLEALKEKLNQPLSRGKLIVTPVHFSGIPVDVESIDKGIHNPNTLIIEDAAHALGSLYLDKTPVGSCRYSHMTMFSFHPVKNITTGEGGVITTNELNFYRRLKQFRNNGLYKTPAMEEKAPWFYQISDLSGNYNFTDFQAALGLSQLKKLDNFVTKRQSLVKVYREQLAENPFVSLPPSIYDELSSWHLCPLKIDFSSISLDRASLMKALKKEGIYTQVHYIPLYKILPNFKEKELCESSCREMERFYEQELSFPLFYTLEEKDVVIICDKLKKLLTPAH